MNKKTYIIVGVVVVVLVVVGAASRYLGRSAAERAIEQATGGKAQVNTDNGTVTVKTDQGTWSTSDKLPADFPTDVPIYPGAKVQASVAGAQGQTGSHYAALETTDALGTVIAWYKKEIVAQGWTVASDATIQGNLIMGATKDTRELSVTVTGDQGKVTVGLVVANK